MSLAEWEKLTPKLGKIESCAWWISHYADEIIGTVELTPSMPKFETRAEDALHTAHEKLAQAIRILMMKERKD